MYYSFEHPFDLLATWLKDAEDSELNDPNAVYDGTVGPDGQPSVRTVLLKGLDSQGPVFYTNLTSRKGQDMAGHDKIALLFHWKSLERQVSVEGTVNQVSDGEANAYFASRSRGSQIGAHASLQSQPLSAPKDLDARVQETETKFEGQDVPRPDHWSGLRLTATRFEFWQAGEYRLHEREVLTPNGDGWSGQHLYP